MKAGCKKKSHRTLKSKITNLTPTKLKARKSWLPFACSLKASFPPVYLQRYGSCTSNAVLGCDDMIYHNNPAKWKPSTTFTYYNQKKDEKPMVDDGSCVETALDTVKKYGACSAAVWENERPFNEKPSAEAYANGLKGKEIKKWYEIKNLRQLKEALVSGYPVVTAVAWVYDGYDEHYVIKVPADKDVEKCYIGHAIVVVGYDDISQLIEIRNSWGEGWGNNGYAYYTYDTFEKVVWWEDTYAIVK